jgi:hypothetical protein
MPNLWMPDNQKKLLDAQTQQIHLRAIKGDKKMGINDEKLSDMKILAERAEHLYEQKYKIVLNWQITILLVVTLIGLFLLALAWSISPVVLGASCDIKGIHYDNVCPSKCWNDEINCAHCPLPTDVQCNVNGQAPMIKIIQMLR